MNQPDRAHSVQMGDKQGSNSEPRIGKHYTAQIGFAGNTWADAEPAVAQGFRDAAPRRSRLGNPPNKENLAMRMKKLGNTGLAVSELCMGAMTFGHSSGPFAATATGAGARTPGPDRTHAGDAARVRNTLCN